MAIDVIVILTICIFKGSFNTKDRQLRFVRWGVHMMMHSPLLFFIGGNAI